MLSFVSYLSFSRAKKSGASQRRRPLSCFYTRSRPTELLFTELSEFFAQCMDSNDDANDGNYRRTFRHKPPHCAAPRSVRAQAVPLLVNRSWQPEDLPVNLWGRAPWQSRLCVTKKNFFHNNFPQPLPMRPRMRFFSTSQTKYHINQSINQSKSIWINTISNNLMPHFNEEENVLYFKKNASISFSARSSPKEIVQWLVKRCFYPQM